MFAAFGKACEETSIGIPKETFLNERRVAISPEATQRLTKLGFTINVERGAGVESEFYDSALEKAGATIVDNAYQSDIILKVRAPTMEETDKLNNDSGLISFINPAQNQELVDKLKEKNITCYGMEQIPRLSRA